MGWVAFAMGIAVGMVAEATAQWVAFMFKWAWGKITAKKPTKK